MSETSAAPNEPEAAALASKVVFPSDAAIETASMRDFGLGRKDHRPKTCTNHDFYIAVTSSFIRGAKWAMSKINIEPKEQVISPDINKKEISNDMSKKCEKFDQSKTLNEENDMSRCVCDETHIHNCPVHTHLQDEQSAPNEPEVKAQAV